MSKRIKKISLLFILIILVFMIYQSANIRFVGYERIPNIGIFDERNYVMQGLGVGRYGIPMGWSDSSAYERTQGDLKSVKITNFTIKINEEIPTLLNIRSLPKPVYAVEQYDFGLGMQHLKLVLPFIDHSPVGGFIMSLGVPNNVRDFLDLKPEHFRKMSLTLAIVTSVLLFIFVILVTKNTYIGLLSVLIYSTIPTFLLSSRYALLENVLAPFALLHLILLYVSQQISSKNSRLSIIFLLVSAFLGGVSILIKETGIGFVLSSLVLMTIWKYPRKYFLFFILTAIIPIIMYISYVCWISPKLFIEIFTFNATRGFFGSLSFVSMLPILRFPDFPYDGWWIWGFISLLLISLIDGKKYLGLIIPLIGHLLVILLSSNLNYPWYYLALNPFLAAVSAWSLWYIFKSPSLPLLGAFFLIPLSSSFYWGFTVFSLPPQILSYRILFVIFFAFAALRQVKSDSQKVKIIWWIFCILLLIQITQWNIRSIYFIIAHWHNLPFPSLPSF